MLHSFSACSTRTLLPSLKGDFRLIGMVSMYTKHVTPLEALSEHEAFLNAKLLHCF
jgi:hypothetical protein